MKISLKKGWNLVSFKTTDLSVIVSNKNIIEIKSGLKSWNRSVPVFFNTLTKLEFNDGYYVLVADDTIIEYIQMIIERLEYKLVKGWNLIGWQEDIYFEKLQIDDKFLQIKGLETSYDSTVPNIFNNLKELKEGNAYWVKVSDNYNWLINKSNIEIKLDFDENFREYNVNIKSNGSSTNIEGYIKSSLGSINLDNYLVFQPGDKNRQMEINNDTTSKFIVPDLENEEVKFKIRTVNLPNDKYMLNISGKDYPLDIPKVKDYDYSESNYFQNDTVINKKQKLLFISFIGADNDLERYCYLDMIEMSQFVQKNKDNYDICMIALVDRSNYSSINDDTKEWFNNETFNVTISDKTFGIYICNYNSDNKWSNFEIGNYLETLNIIQNEHNNISTKKEVLDLFLDLVLGNLIDSEKNNPNIALLLNFWNHGNYYGVSVDPKTVYKMLYMNDIYESVREYLDKYNIDILDYLVFDCCLTASLSNIKLFSNISKYIMSASTTVPNLGNYYNYTLPVKGSIKNVLLEKLFDNTISSYNIFLKSLSVFDSDRFLFFEDNMKYILERTTNITDINGKFKSLPNIDYNFENTRSLILFLKNIRIESYDKLKKLYDKFIITSSEDLQAIAINDKKRFYKGQILDRVNNIEYFYNFFKNQNKKGTVIIKFSSTKDNDSESDSDNFITFINIEINGIIEDDIMIRFSNGFSYVNEFEIVESNATIYQDGLKKFLKIKPKNTNIKIRSKDFIEVIYYNGFKYYIEGSKFNDVLQIKGEDYHIESLSESLELSKTNTNIITGEIYNKFGEFEILDKGDYFEITGNSYNDENIILAFQRVDILNNYYLGFISEYNKKSIGNEINLKIEIKVLKINDIVFPYIESYEDENIIRYVCPVLYQENLNEDPTFDSILVNLELIKDKKNNTFTKKLWNSYGTVISELFGIGYIYPIDITDYNPEITSNIFNLFGKKYHIEFDPDFFLLFEDIKEFNLLNIKDVDPIFSINLLSNKKIFKEIFEEINNNPIFIDNLDNLDNLNENWIKSNILLTNKVIEINSNIYIPGFCLIVGEDSILINNNTIDVVGSIVIQDNGKLINNGTINLYNEGKIILTSANKNKVSQLVNNNLIEGNSNSKIFITGYSILENNNYLVMYDGGSIHVTSLNPSYLVENKYTISSKTYSKLINYGKIIVNLLEINYGGYLENDTNAFIVTSISKLLNYFEPNTLKIFESIIEDYNESCKTLDDLAKIENYLFKFKNRTNRMIIQYNDNVFIDNNNVNNKIDIFGLCDIDVEKINNTIGNITSDFKLNIDQDEKNIILKVKNIGFNGFGQLLIYSEIFSRYFKSYYLIYDTIENTKIISKLKYIYILENFYNNLGIKPVLFKDDMIEIKFNKFKIAESINSFNENITINFSINAYDLIKESNYDNNSVGITFYVEK